MRDEVVEQRAEDRRRDERDDHAEREAPRRGVARQVLEDGDDPSGIDREQGEDRAELDQNLEGAAGALEAEQLAGEQEMGRRGYWQKLRYALDDAEDDRIDCRSEIHDFPRAAATHSAGGRIVLFPPQAGSIPERPAGPQIRKKARFATPR